MKLNDLPEHHAIAIVCQDRQHIANSLFKELVDDSLSHRLFNQTVLDITIANSIVSWAKAPASEKKVAVISFHTAGLEAQNVMLKILEEPNELVKFILVTSNEQALLGTVTSRVVLVKIDSESTTDGLATLFLATESTLRIKLPAVVSLLLMQDEENRKDREAVRAFILSLLGVLSKDKAGKKYCNEVLEISTYASDPSVSGKALIEYLSLLLPQVKN